MATDSDTRHDSIPQGWQPIETAPKDGRVIIVAHDEMGAFEMAWNPIGTNPMFAPGEIGIWEAPDRSFTWRAGEFGPDKWAPLPSTPPLREGNDKDYGNG